MITAYEAAEIAEKKQNNNRAIQQALSEIESFIIERAQRGDKELTYNFINLSLEEIDVVLEKIEDAGYHYMCNCARGILTMTW